MSCIVQIVSLAYPLSQRPVLALQFILVLVFVQKPNLFHQFSSSSILESQFPSDKKIKTSSHLVVKFQSQFLSNIKSKTSSRLLYYFKVSSCFTFKSFPILVWQSNFKVNSRLTFKSFPVYVWQKKFKISSHLMVN